ncbi:MAG: thiamine diphosphokinase [Clostridiales bacterium]|nr:thiamine diphosphokinase [Clostridiales bacterium]
MNTLIISGGSIDIDLALRVLEEKYDHIIGVDGGLGFCYEQKILPTRIVGDFDTLDPEILAWYKDNTQVEIREYNSVKDATDTQIAVELALELGSTRITILGATGTRLDHVLGNIQTLYLPLQRGVDCVILDPNNRIRLIEKQYVLRREEQYGKYFSLIPLTTDVKGVTLKGVKYPLDRYHFTTLGSGSLGVSNEVLKEQAEISMESGIFVLIESKD